MAFNLGGIETLTLSALSIESQISSTFPIRVMMAVACFVAFAAIIYVVLEQLRLELGLSYLARQSQSEALELDGFGDWLASEYPMISRAKKLSIAAFISFCAAILIIDVLTLFHDFSQ